MDIMRCKENVNPTFVNYIESNVPYFSWKTVRDLCPDVELRVLAGTILYVEYYKRRFTLPDVDRYSNLISTHFERFLGHYKDLSSGISEEDNVHSQQHD